MQRDEISKNATEDTTQKLTVSIEKSGKKLYNLTNIKIYATNTKCN